MTRWSENEFESWAKEHGVPVASAQTLPETLAPSGGCFTFPYPPSANRYWRNVKGRMILSPDARAYRTEITRLISLMGVTPLTGEVAVILRVFRPLKSGDLDGRIKQLLDALQGHLYINDSQIVSINARRFDDKLNPRVEVSVHAA